MNEDLLYFGTSIVIILLTIVVATLVNRFFIRMIKKSSNELSNDPTNYKFLRHLIVFLIYTIGFSVTIYTVPELRTLASSLLAGAGILAVAVGFASQHALSNIIGGVFIVIFKPFRVNDRITVKQMTGWVEDITLRHTVIRDFENKRIVIPNALISEEVIVNADMEESRICNFINIGIAYSSDIKKAKEIIAEEIQNHPLNIDIRTSEDIATGLPRVTVRLINLAESSVTIRGWAWSKNAGDGFIMQCDILESALDRFKKEHIEIPFPHRTVIMKK